ncbi:hypothetical protein RUM43_000816 [Polyplax serrata]|uniref:Golgi SNAP receptor complex member 2 n=1 Tax=Polyplax serrata TaxID=468196 RepID=A0AAN8SDY0_POLSC
MEALYHQTNKLVEETQSFFARLERSMKQDAESLEEEIQTRIDIITKNCEKLDIMAYKDPVARMQTSKSRIDQLKHDNKRLQSALSMLQHKRRKRELEAQETEELLHRKFKPLREDTTIFIDHSLQHQNSLQRANRNLDDLISVGSGVLENLKEQRMTLKGAHKKMMDLANTLGLSNTTMRLIENRVKEDKWILLGGMFLTMLIIFLFILYVKV